MCREHNLGLKIEKAISRVTDGKIYPLAGLASADEAVRIPIPLMYCAFTYRMGMGSTEAAKGLLTFHGRYYLCERKSISELLEMDSVLCEQVCGISNMLDGKELVERIISDFEELCK